MTRNLPFAKLALAGLLALTAPAFAADEHNVSAGLTAAGAPLGLHGVDPVAFIDLGNRIEGTARFTAVHDGVAYYFASAENQAAFDDYVRKTAGGGAEEITQAKKLLDEGTITQSEFEALKARATGAAGS